MATSTKNWQSGSAKATASAASAAGRAGVESGTESAAAAGSSVHRVVIAAVLLVAAAPRIWIAVRDQGIFWPDEIFQTLEPAHDFAFGYGFVAWEFQDGARSWLFPGILGLLWKFLALLGVNGAPALVISAKLLMTAWALAGVAAAMRLGERLAGTQAAVLCGVLAAVFPPALVYGGRCMTEMASGPALLLATLLVLDSDRRHLVLAGILAALAIYLRYQNGIVTTALLVWLAAQRRWDDARWYAAGAVAAGLAGGILDWFTWGSAFHSFLTYVRFNLIEGRSAEYGVESAGYYFTTFWSAVGVSGLALVAGLCAAARRHTGPTAVLFAYVLAHTAVAHKEFRFLMPVAPLLLTLAGVGLAALLERVPGSGEAEPRRPGKRSEGRRNAAAMDFPEAPAPGGIRASTWAVATLLAATMGWRAAGATFDDYGQRHGPFSGPLSVWHAAEPVNRLLWAAGERADLCALGLVGYGPIWTGGFTYLHRDVPILWPPNLTTEAANYMIVRSDVELPGEYATLAAIGEARLARRDGACAAPPAGPQSRLFSK